MIISIINQKGGVGKTTTAHSLGMGLAHKGFKVLFIDLDAQTNLTYVLGADNTGASRNTSLELLADAITIAQAIQHFPDFDLIAASPALTKANTLLDETGKEHKLRLALEPIKEEYDYVIIDNPPALGILPINALTASDGCIIPAQADTFSVQGIANLKKTIDLVHQFTNQDLEVMGILLIRYNSRAVISREIAEMAMDTAKKFNSKLFNIKIRECTALKECQLMQQSIFEYAPKSNAAADYNSLISEIIGE